MSEVSDGSRAASWNAFVAHSLLLIALCLWGTAGGVLWGLNADKPVMTGLAYSFPLEFAHDAAVNAIEETFPAPAHAPADRRERFLAASPALESLALPTMPGSVRFAIVYPDGDIAVFPLPATNEDGTVLSEQRSTSLLHAARHGGRTHSRSGVAVLPRGAEEKAGDFVIITYHAPFPLLSGDLVVIGQFPATLPEPPEAADRTALLIVLWCVSGLLLLFFAARLVWRVSRPEALSAEQAGMEQGQNVLSQTEEEYLSLIENAQEAIAVLGKKQILFANPGFAYILGGDRHGILHVDYSTLLYEKDRAAMEESVTALLAGRTDPIRMPLRFKTALGDLRSVACTLTSAWWRGERAVVLFALDLTPLGEARQNLALSKARKNSLLHYVDAGVAFFDLFGNLVLSNRQWDLMWNRDGQGFRFSGESGPDKDPGLAQAMVCINEALQGTDGSIPRLEHTVNGERHFLTLHFYPLRDTNETVIGAMALHYEKDTEYELERRIDALARDLEKTRLDSLQAKERLALLLDSLGFAAIVIDAEAHVALWNADAEIRWATDREDALGRKIVDAAPELASSREAIEKAVREQTHLRSRTALGEPFTVIPFVTPQGKGALIRIGG